VFFSSQLPTFFFFHNCMTIYRFSNQTLNIIRNNILHGVRRILHLNPSHTQPETIHGFRHIYKPKN
jgi:hypothetical protein